MITTKTTRLFFFQFLFITLSNFSISAQIVCNVSLTSQLAVDTFSLSTSNIPECWYFGVDQIIFTISGQDITSLEGLDMISECSEIHIENTSLVNLKGLENLEKASYFYSSNSGIYIKNNLQLESLEGLENLHSTCNLEIINNPALQNTNALNITTVIGQSGGNSNYSKPSVKVFNNTMLTNIVGLSGLVHSSNISIVDNPSLIDISGLSNLRTVRVQTSPDGFAGDFIIENNDGLSSLSNLGPIYIEKLLDISDNNALENLSGMEVSPGYFEIENNENLTEFGDLSLTLHENWFGFSYWKIINNPVLSSIGLKDFKHTWYENTNVIEISGNPELDMCSEGYICYLMEGDEAQFDINNNADGCNSEDEVSICDGYKDIEVNMEMSFVSCDLLRYNIIVSKTSDDGDSTLLKFYLENDDVNGQYSIVETDQATIVDDTLIWDVTNLSAFNKTFSILLEVGEDYNFPDSIVAVASISDDSYSSNNHVRQMRGFAFDLNLTLTTQEDVDNCKCYGRFGTLRIKDGEDITNLNGLLNVTSINRFEIDNNPLLQSIDGLEKLERMDRLTISNNDALSSITGFNNITEGFPFLVSNLDLYSNRALTDLSGFASVQEIRELNVSDNMDLQNLNDFSSLQEVRTLIIKNNPKLVAFDSLYRITEILYGLNISGNTLLNSLQGLHHINRIGDFTFSNNSSFQDLKELSNITISNGDIVTISDNESLLSLEGLDFFYNNLDSAIIRDNPMLDMCNTEFICELVVDDDVNSVFENNADCNSIEEVASSCITSTDNQQLSGVIISPNPFQESFTIVNGSEDELTYELYNTIGQRIAKGKLYKTATIDLEDKTTGVFFLKLRDGQNRQMTSRLIKI